MSKNKKILQDFIKYCKENPEERFWQALRNWSKFNFIFGGHTHELTDDNLKDTFYWEGKNK